MTATQQRLNLVYGLTHMDEAPRERRSPEAAGAKDEFDSENVRKTRFRFKSRGQRQSSDTVPDAAADADTQPLHRSKRRKTNGHDHDEPRAQDGRSRRHGRRRGNRHRHGSDDNKEPPNPTYEMDAESAFRESLFDALADDEGAAFWEGVYGQPIHTYPNTKPAEDEGEVRQMSDEEYTAYVRQQMWEKSHQHVIEERRKREEAAERRREGRRRTSRMESEKEAFDRKMEESLKKGEERRREKAWREAWNGYARKWAKLMDKSKSASAGESSAESGDLIPWPSRSGKAADVGKDEVEAFFEHAALRDASKDSLRAMLKVERVRWHPDKMQQRFGSNRIDAETLKAVIAVFQIVDAQFARL